MLPLGICFYFFRICPFVHNLLQPADADTFLSSYHHPKTPDEGYGQHPRLVASLYGSAPKASFANLSATPDKLKKDKPEKRTATNNLSVTILFILPLFLITAKLFCNCFIRCVNGDLMVSCNDLCQIVIFL